MSRRIVSTSPRCTSDWRWAQRLSKTLLATADKVIQ
jgi:hypothetical protein